MSDSAKKASTKGAAATIAIVLVTSLFFVWGLAMNLVSSLNAPIANYLELTTTQTSLMQVAYYGAYFVMAIPAGAIAKKFGYKGGVIAGLALFVIDCHHHGACHERRLVRPVPGLHVRRCRWRHHARGQLQPLYH